MPLYEYKCAKCGEVFELIQRFSDETLTTHEKCGGAVERLISTSALQFKGSGWYINDYAKGGRSADNGDSKKNDAPAASKSDSGADSSGKAKPETGSSSDKTSGSEAKSSSSSTKSGSSDTK